jgi:hypothetical protein
MLRKSKQTELRQTTSDGKKSSFNLTMPFLPCKKKKKEARDGTFRALNVSFLLNPETVIHHCDKNIPACQERCQEQRKRNGFEL